MLLTGMLPRTTVKCSSSFSPGRYTPSLTLLPFSPFRRFMASSLVTIFPTKAESSTSTIRSPAISPTFSDGPPWMTLFTWMVSFWMVNWIPMPLKLPLRSAVTASRSLAGIYEECGSSSERICGMASSTRSLILTVSTYWSSMIRNKAFNLLEEVLMMPSLLPEKWLA